MPPMIIDVLGTYFCSATEPSHVLRVAHVGIQRNVNLSSVRVTITVPFSSHMRSASCDWKTNSSKNDSRPSGKAIMMMTTRKTMWHWTNDHQEVVRSPSLRVNAA